MSETCCNCLQPINEGEPGVVVIGDRLRHADTVCVQVLRAALARVEQERDELGDKLACLLDHCTGGRFSKTNYDKADMYSMVDERAEEWTQEAIEEATAALRRRLAEAVETARTLSNETLGMLTAFEHGLRPVVGNTNYAVLREKATAARAFVEENDGK